MALGRLNDLLDRVPDSCVRGYHFLEDGRDVSARLEYRSLSRHARAVGQRIADAVRPNEKNDVRSQISLGSQRQKMDPPRSPETIRECTG